MEKVKPLEVHVFHNIAKPDIRLYLCKGIVIDENGATLPFSEDRYRWMIRGIRSPFPIRNGTWFKGFEPAIMRKYLADNGYIRAEIVPVHNL